MKRVRQFRYFGRNDTRNYPNEENLKNLLNTGELFSNIAVFPLDKVQACVQVYNSSCWAKVTKSKGAASTVSKEVANSIPGTVFLIATF